MVSLSEKQSEKVRYKTPKSKCKSRIDQAIDFWFSIQREETPISEWSDLISNGEGMGLLGQRDTNTAEDKRTTSLPLYLGRWRRWFPIHAQLICLRLLGVCQYISRVKRFMCVVHNNVICKSTFPLTSSPPKDNLNFIMEAPNQTSIDVLFYE